MADFFQRSMVFFLIFFYSGLGGGRRQKVGLYNKLPICCTESTSRSQRTSPPKKEKYNYTTCKYFNQKKHLKYMTHKHTPVCNFSVSSYPSRTGCFFLPPLRSKLHCIHAASPPSTERRSDQLPAASSRSSPFRSPGEVWLVWFL